MMLGTKGRTPDLMAIANAVLWLLLVVKRFCKISDTRVVSLLGISGSPTSSLDLFQLFRNAQSIQGDRYVVGIFRLSIPIGLDLSQRPVVLLASSAKV